jgi:hypothetical protein
VADLADLVDRVGLSERWSIPEPGTETPFLLALLASQRLLPLAGETKSGKWAARDV